MDLAKAAAGVLTGMGFVLLVASTANAQIQCVISGPTGKATADARTCTVADSVRIAQTQAQAMVDQQVRCPILTGPAVNPICWRNGLKPALGQFWPRGQITPPKGY